MTDTEAYQLNREVYEEVLGLSWPADRCRWCGGPLVESPDAGCWAHSCARRPLPRTRADAMPYYSTDIERAWEVVDHMAEQGWECAIELVQASTEWWAWFRRPGSEEHFTGSGHTAPEAICRAALEAVRAGREARREDDE